MKLDIILDIEELLTIMEKTVDKYITMPDGACFIKGYRNPLENRYNLDKYEKMKQVRNKPWHPYISAYIVRDCFYFHLYTNNSYAELLDYNPVTGNKSRVYDVNTNYDIGDIILKYVENISKEDLVLLMGYVNKALDIFNSKVKYMLDNVFTIDISSQHFVIHNLEHIKAYRFQEVLDNMENNHD